MGLALRVLITLLFFLLGGAAGAQETQGLRLEGPTRVPGDGATTFEVTVRNAPGGSAVANADVTLNSGRLVARRELDEGATVLELMPPRVIELSEMTVSVRIPGLGQTEHRVELSPAFGASGRFVSKGRLGLDVPQRMILGVDQEAEIRFRASPPGGVELHVSQGTVSAPTAGSGSVMVAKYRPPDTKFPTLAIVAALSEDGAILDWAPIRLYGQPAIATRSEENAAVTVKIEGESFGPIRADRSGRATLRVLVPPGVGQARVLARDALGNERTVPLALETPTSWPLYALCPAESERVHVFALDGAGRPRSGVKLVITPSLGELSAPRRLEGYSMFDLSLPPSAQMGAPLVFLAEIAGEPTSQARCESSVVGEAPVRMSLTAVPASWNPALGDTVTVRAEFEFAGYRTPRVVPILPKADFGEVVSVRTPSPQIYELTWRLPPRLGHRDQANISVSTDTGRPVSASLTLPLAPAPPDRIELRLGAGRLVANGIADTSVEVRVLDRFGNLHPDAPLVVSATGSVSRLRQEPDGTLVGTYRAPRSLRLTSDRVEVRLRNSPLVARATMVLEPIQGGVRLLGRLGHTIPLGKLSGPMGSVGATYRLPVLDGGLSVTSPVGLSVATDTRRDAMNVEDVELQSWLVSIGAGLRYDLHVGPLGPYIEAGPRLGVTRLSIGSESTGEYDGWTTAVGAWVAFGVLIPLGPGAVTLDSEYSYLPVDWNGVTGNVGGLFVGGGYSVEL